MSALSCYLEEEESEEKKIEEITPSSPLPHLASREKILGSVTGFPFELGPSLPAEETFPSNALGISGDKSMEFRAKRKSHSCMFETRNQLLIVEQPKSHTLGQLGCFLSLSPLWMKVFRGGDELIGNSRPGLCAA